MTSISKDEYFMNKSEKDLENSNFTSSPEAPININNKSKNWLPSFLLEKDYFNDCSSNGDNESNENNEINENHKHNLSDSGEEEKEIKFEQMKLFDEANNIETKDKNNNNVNSLDYQNNKNILLNNNNNKIVNDKNKIPNNETVSFNNKINFNNSGNNYIQNFYYSLANNGQKNFINNSFNNRVSNYYYQNYFNLSNNSNLSPNIINNISNKNSNNINIVNGSNSYINNNNPPINPYANSFGPIYPHFNTLNYQHMFSAPIKQNNNSNGQLNNFNYINAAKDELNKNKCFSFSFNHPFSQAQQNLENMSSEKKKKKKIMKDKPNDNMTMKKLLNMTDYSLYNYLITQKGSRDVQTVLIKIKESDVEILINKLKNYISDITIDKYGNYFSQKLIQICVPSQRIKVLQNINSRFVEIANNSYGTHPLQTLMEIINMPEEKQLVLSFILGNESVLSLDSKGTHVLQKYISNTVDEEREQLNKNIINMIDKLIIDPFGVCVLIKLVKHTKDKTISQKIANYITEKGPLTFIQHPYANYAVQILLNSTDLSYCGNIIETIVNNYLSLSMQKFSSNVVENCIKYGDENSVKKIYKAIIEQEKLESLLNNNYGNFVLEKLIVRLTKEEKMKFIKKIEKLGKTKSLSNTLRNLLYE